MRVDFNASTWVDFTSVFKVARFRITFKWDVCIDQSKCDAPKANTFCSVNNVYATNLFDTAHEAYEILSETTAKKLNNTIVILSLYCICGVLR